MVFCHYGSGYCNIRDKYPGMIFVLTFTWPQFLRPKSYTKTRTLELRQIRNKSAWMFWNTKNYTNIYTLCVKVFIACVNVHNVCIFNFSVYTLCEHLQKMTHVHGFHASFVMWTRTVNSALGKLLSSCWCFLNIYRTDENFTPPPVALVAPNINSANIRCGNLKPKRSFGAIQYQVIIYNTHTI